MSVKELTDYPDIFICYWGNFKVRDLNITPTIIENRNKLVKDYDILDCKPRGITRRTNRQLRYTKYIRKYLYDNKELEDHFPQHADHREYYKIPNGTLLIHSPYREYDEENELAGFQRIYPVYTSSAYSYAKILNYI